MEKNETFRLKLLYEHNIYRLEYGNVGDLELDIQLTSEAQKHAETMAMKQLSLFNSPNNNIGENHFCTNIKAQCVPSFIVKYWHDISEKNFGKQILKRPNHFTQMIWKSSHKLGIGIAISKSNIFYISAFYFPKGNILKQIDLNVFDRTFQNIDHFQSNVLKMTINLKVSLLFLLL
jgi:glioma pathogenesis-related protein 2